MSFPPEVDGAKLTLPASALLFGSQGVRVARVDADGRVSLRAVTLGRDEGAAVEILSGVTARERVIENPPEALATGDRVRVTRRTAAVDAKR